MMQRGGAPVWAMLMAGLLLAWPAFWNGYPLIFADTGTYLGQAILFYLGWDRPPFYSFFLHALHWRLSLWPVPLVQGLLTAHLLWLLLRVLNMPGAVPLIGTSALLAVATGLPWFAAQLMPDLFTGLTILALWLLGFAGMRISRGERVYLTLFAAGATAVHLSHLPLAIGLALLGCGLAWLRQSAAQGILTAARMALPSVMAALALMGVNAVGHGRASVSPFGSVFVAARLLEDGPALHALQARCPESGWRICDLLGQLPVPANDFLWRPDGLLRGALGGGKAWGREASEIVAATLSEDRGGVLLSALANSLRQLAMFDTGDGLGPWLDLPGPEPLIADFFPWEHDSFVASRQAHGRLLDDAEDFAPLHRVLAWAGLLLLPTTVLLCRRHLPALALCVMVLGAAAGNALITGGLSGPNHRYQARLAWLFPLAPALALVAARQPAYRPSALAARA